MAGGWRVVRSPCLVHTVPVLLVLGGDGLVVLGWLGWAPFGCLLALGGVACACGRVRARAGGNTRWSRQAPKAEGKQN